LEAVTKQAADAEMSTIQFSHISDLASMECTSVEGLLDYYESKIAEFIRTRERKGHLSKG
jgi:hypothetical protein